MRVYLIDGTCRTPVFLDVSTASLTKTIPVLRGDGTISFYKFKCVLRLVAPSGCTAYIVLHKRIASKIVRALCKRNFLDLSKYVDNTICFPDSDDIPLLERLQNM